MGIYVLPRRDTIPAHFEARPIHHMATWKPESEVKGLSFPFGELKYLCSSWAIHSKLIGRESAHYKSDCVMFSLASYLLK
jgi:hypothetical protein